MPHVLHWFRRDLRTHDNTALAHASELVSRLQASHLQASELKVSKLKANAPQTKLSAVFVVPPKQWAEHDMSAVQVDFIFRTLAVLQADLYQQYGIALHILYADDFASGNDKLMRFVEEQKVTHVLANSEYEVNEQRRDQQLSERLVQTGVEFITHDDQCILPPNSVLTNDGEMYQVFTPFYHKWQARLDTSPPQPHELKPHELSCGWASDISDDWLRSAQHRLNEQHQQCLASYPHVCAETVLTHAQEQYPAGETAGKRRLAEFITDDIGQYQQVRDRPADAATSHLSAYLAIGAISPRHCYLMAKHALANADGSQQSGDIQTWISELAWRDFYRHVIFNRPDIVRHHAYKRDIDRKVNWSYDQWAFERWCVGKTGVPLVDAAMRCLAATGFMHNRLRMVVAMFLTKDLLIDWRWGERYFMQQLIDGDFASNNGGWQWSASVGTDSAPYFRIMNPFSQAKSHDKDGVFIKTWLPELSSLPVSVLHDEQKLQNHLKQHAGIDYPLVMVAHKQARLDAIAEFKK